jgi:hypothetical protein
MAQLNLKAQIRSFAGMNAGGWTPVTCPIYEARTVTIFNPDLGADIELCTDPNDTAAVVVIPPSSQHQIRISSKALSGYIQDQVIAYVRGSGDQPKLTFEA